MGVKPWGLVNLKEVCNKSASSQPETAIFSLGNMDLFVETLELLGSADGGFLVQAEVPNELTGTNTDQGWQFFNESPWFECLTEKRLAVAMVWMRTTYFGIEASLPKGIKSWDAWGTTKKNPQRLCSAYIHFWHWQSTSVDPLIQENAQFWQTIDLQGTPPWISYASKAAGKVGAALATRVRV